MIDPKQIDPNKLNAQESGQADPPAVSPTLDPVDENNKQPTPTLTPNLDSPIQDLGTNTPDLDSKQKEETKETPSEDIKKQLSTLGISPKSNPAKPVNKTAYLLIGLLLLLVSIPAGVFLVKQRQEIRKEAAEGEFCTYGQTCIVDGHSGTQSCTGTIQDGSCKYDPSVDPNCSPCGYCGDGECGGGEGPDNCPQDCEAPPEQACCSGTRDCPGGQQCIRTLDPDCSTCQLQPGDYPGWCAGPEDCAHWEVCENNSCRSEAGCVYDSDCAEGAKCISGTCAGVGDVDCFADQTGVSIVNNSDKSITGNVDWFSRWCDHENNPSCTCKGSPSIENNQTIGPGETWSRNILGNGPPTQCAYQSDITFTGDSSCHSANANCEEGCDSTPTPTPPTSTPTKTPTPTPTGTLTPTPTPTKTPTPTPTGTPTPTPTSTPTGTLTPTPTPTSGPTSTPVPGPTSTPTPEVQLPEAGFALPTFQGIVTGLLLLIMGALLIL